MSPDLNPLVSMDALLQERSVSRAARRLCLSRPGLSAALTRLRRHYSDDLLVRVGPTNATPPMPGCVAWPHGPSGLLRDPPGPNRGRNTDGTLAFHSFRP